MPSRLFPPFTLFGRFPLPAGVIYAAYAAFFLTVLAIGLGIHGDYGVSFDERQQRYSGGVSLKHVVERIAPRLLPDSASRLPALDDYADRDYGVAFELPAAALEVLLGIKDDREVMLFRHLLTFLVALAGIVAVERMAYRRFRDGRLALLAAAFLVLSPRLFAESFYNSKDIVFMALFAVATWAAVEFVLRPRPWTALLAAVAAALAIDVRIMAVILPCATLSILALRVAKRQAAPQAIALTIPLYAIALCVVVVAMWPWLWSAPVTNFIQAFQNMAKFRWEGDVLYLGTVVPGGALPWHYVGVWIAVTTPLLYLALFVAGASMVLGRLASARLQLWKDDDELQDLFYLGLVVVPLVAVIGLKSVLYDGWRQMYFIYPAFLMIAVRGFAGLWESGLPGPHRRVALAAIVAVTLGHTAWWMWREHPFQNVYFNHLAGVGAGAGAGSRFELDYWGVSNRQGLDYILKTDPSEVITVAAASFTPLADAGYMLRADDRKRIKYTADVASAQYLFTNYRMVRDPIAQRQALSEECDPYYEIKVGGHAILTIYRRKL